MDTPPVTTTELPRKGRSIISLRPLKGGEIILPDSPLLLYSTQPFHPNTPNLHTYCSTCFINISQTPQTTSSCPSCTSHFCSPTCHSSATSHSTWTCQTLTHPTQYFTNHTFPIDLQLQARFLVSAYNLGLVSPDKFKMLLLLQGCDTDSDTDLESVNLLYSLIRPNVGELELVRVLLAKDKVNAFGLMEVFTESGERSVRAYGIYPVASFFNHDCLPNACRFDYIDGSGSLGLGNSTEMSVRMIHDVPEGREICLSYFPVNLKYVERQKRLKDDYGFVCECDRCKVEANWSRSDEEGADMDDGDSDENVGEDDEESNMDEDVDEEMDGEGEDGGVMKGENDDFPHAYFFLNYMCERKNCGGTLPPLPPSVGTSNGVMECNVCGNFKKLDQV